MVKLNSGSLFNAKEQCLCTCVYIHVGMHMFTFNSDSLFNVKEQCSCICVCIHVGMHVFTFSGAREIAQSVKHL